MARQSDGAAIVRYGDTMVLVTVISAKGREGLDFFPLFVDYREKPYAVGKVPGGFFKREGRPTTQEILTMRLTDRPIRPLFPDGYRNEVQIQAMVLSSDRENQSDVLCVIGASAALCVSKIPFLGPIGCTRVARVNGETVAFPTYAEASEGAIDIVSAGKKDMLLMVEGFSQEVDETEILEALTLSQDLHGQIVEMQEELIAKIEVPKKEIPEPEDLSEITTSVRERVWDELNAALGITEKLKRGDVLDSLKEKTIDAFVVESGLESDEAEELQDRVKSAFKSIEKSAMRGMITEGRRLDGRSAEDVRPIDIELGLLPRTHGSSLFTRGETQALVVLTLGTMDDEQRVEGLIEEYKKRFLLHYNFPPFSVGEVRPIRGPGRREIGHGMLAERSLCPVLPPWEDFPYTIRLVSDILESNGSSSMASVCGGTMALMDGGVPIKRPVAGIAMGLIRENGEYHVLTDIQGAEDHFGDMDFKVTGTQNGVTGLQMDIKIDGIPREVLEKALGQARDARMHVLREMLGAMERPREDLSPFAPKLLNMVVPTEKIGLIIGPGGKMIKRIQDEFSVSVDIEEDGRLTIAGSESDKVKKAKEYVDGLVSEPEIGKIYEGRVVSIKDFGCFVEFLPGQEGLCHISELAEGFIDRVDDVVSEGETIQVRVVGFDDRGKVKLSRRAVEGGGESRPGRPGGGRGGRPPKGGRGGGKRPPRSGGRNRRERD
jgi:polyribonucleotide nucleotidyltransferase